MEGGFPNGGEDACANYGGNTHSGEVFYF